MSAKYTLIRQTNIPDVVEQALQGEWRNAQIYAQKCANCGTLIISWNEAVQCPSVNCGVTLLLKNVTGKTLAQIKGELYVPLDAMEEEFTLREGGKYFP